MNELLPTPLPLCWCDSRHGEATHLVDNATPICGECAEGVARAYPLPPGWRAKAEETA